MRDPRFEPAQMEIVGGCTAGLPSQVRAHLAPAAPADARGPAPAVKVALDVTRIDQPSAAVHVEQAQPPEATTIDLPLPPLEAGAYAARLQTAGGRHDAQGLRVRGWRRRMGRLAPRPAAARGARPRDGRGVRHRVRGRHARAAEAHAHQRRAARDSARPCVALVPLGGFPPRRALAGPPSRRPDVTARDPATPFGIVRVVVWRLIRIATAGLAVAVAVALSAATPAAALVWPDVAERVERDLRPRTPRRGARQPSSFVRWGRREAGLSRSRR